MTKKVENIPTKIWQDNPSPDNPFVTETSICHGYDVYGDLLENASFIDYLFLLFMGEAPTQAQKNLLESLAVALANPGPRDHSVRAAMNGGAGGSSNAACLIAALGVGAGNLGGGHEVSIAMKIWQICGCDISKWEESLVNPPEDDREDVWNLIEHAPGFDPNAQSCSKPVLQTLEYLKQFDVGTALNWLSENRIFLESITDSSLAMSGVAAAAIHDLGLNDDQGEMLYLLLRLPGATVHAVERRQYGWRQYPFFGDKLKFKDK